MITICKNCKYLNNTMPNSDIWYGYFCKAPKIQKKDSIDYLTGRITKDPTYCRDINTNGNCPHYEAISK